LFYSWAVGGEGYVEAADQRVVEDKVNRPNHYNINWKGEQTIETYTYIRSWKMDYPESNIIKYVTRHPYKGKSLQDLKKARWYLDKLIEEVEASESR
jgi:hypothetical protein|tara:strand:+ start:436 stop:726 length:291 start_codon:yes stop_codon:yes gene_type:complete